jgi:hypothetical protein
MLAHGGGEIGLMRVVFLGSVGFSPRRKTLRARIRDARKSKNTWFVLCAIAEGEGERTLS